MGRTWTALLGCSSKREGELENHLTIKRLQGAVLTLPGGQRITVTKLGQGRFSTAWSDGAAVYVQTHEKDRAKEILCGLRGTPHLPDVEHLDTVGIWEWYRMPLYGPLNAKSGKAWEDFKALKLARDNATKDVPLGSTGERWLMVNRAFVDQVESTPGIEEYAETVRDLVDACANYGDGWLIEPLQKRNCVVGLSRELILLDPIFDAYLMEAEYQAAAKRRALRF